MSQTIEETETDFLKSFFIYASESKTRLKEMNLLSFKPLWRLCNVFQIKKRTASGSNNAMLSRSSTKHRIRKFHVVHDARPELMFCS